MFEDVSDIVSLPNTLTQNGLDYIAKQYQTIYDAFFGSENDNSEEPLVTPLILNGYGAASANVYFWDSSLPANYYACWFYDVHIYGDNMPDTYFGSPLFDEDFSNQRNSSVTGSNRDRCVQVARGISDLFNISGNSSFATPVTLKYHTEANPYIIHYTNFPNYYDENIFSITSGYRNFGTKQKLEIVRKQTSDGDLSYFYSDRFRCNLLTEKQFYTNTVNDNFVNGVVNNNTYNQQTYTTNQGDTITYYYNDNSVIIPSSGGGGVGVGGVGGVALAYVDIESIFGSLLDDVNLSIGGGSDLHFPSYDEIKYGDYGDFYIEPLHQYDKIPTAPAFDGTIDLGNYPSVLAEGANTFLNFMPVTLSALFTAAFVVCVLLRKLGR